MRKKKKPMVVDKDLLNKKGTKELLGYLQKLHQREDSFESSDKDINEDLVANTTIYYKKTKKWKVAYENVKSILAIREHIEKTKKEAMKNKNSIYIGYTI